MGDRYMGEFPIQYSEKGPAVVRMPQASYSVDTGDAALGKGIASMGSAMAELGQKIDAQEAAAELSTQKRKIDEIGYAAFQAFDSATDDESRNKVRQQFSRDIQSVQSKRSDVNRALTIHLNDVLPQWNNAFESKTIAIKKKNADDQFDFNIENLQINGGFDEADKLIQQRVATGNIIKAKGDLLVSENDVKRKKYENEKQKDAVLSLAKSLVGPDYTTTKAYEAIDASDLPDEDKLNIQSRISAYASGRRKKDATDKYAKKLDFTKNFLKSATEGTVTADMIEKQYPSNEGQSLEEKNKFYSILEGVNDTTTPITVTGESGSEVRQAVFDSAAGKISTNDAYEKILTARYVSKTIDDATMGWAIKRMEKPYPAEITNDLKAQLVANREKIKQGGSWFNPLSWGETDAESNKTNQVNMDLLNWVDSEIDKKHIPTGKELYVRSQELIAGAKLTSTGQTTTNPRPEGYPDAVWNAKHNMWTVSRNGRLMGIQ